MKAVDKNTHEMPGAIDHLTPEEENTVFTKLKDSVQDPTMKNLVELFIKNHKQYRRYYQATISLYADDHE